MSEICFKIYVDGSNKLKQDGQDVDWCVHG